MRIKRRSNYYQLEFCFEAPAPREHRSESIKVRVWLPVCTPLDFAVQLRKKAIEFASEAGLVAWEVFDEYLARAHEINPAIKPRKVTFHGSEFVEMSNNVKVKRRQLEVLTQSFEVPPKPANIKRTDKGLVRGGKAREYNEKMKKICKALNALELPKRVVEDD